jgi:hypothetical protein
VQKRFSLNLVSRTGHGAVSLPPPLFACLVAGHHD